MKRVNNHWRIICMCALSLFSMSGCHFEQGKLYLGNADVVTLPDFRGEVAKAHDCLVANVNMTKDEFIGKFEEKLAQSKIDENWKYWGGLVCLALNEHASQDQIGKTVLLLTDYIEPGHRGHKDLEAMTLILKKKLDNMIALQSIQHIANKEKKQNMIQKVECELELLAQRKVIKDLEEQVQKLKEIEKMIENKIVE